LAALVVLTAGGMTLGVPDHPVRMSGLHVKGLIGLAVVDRAGGNVGEVLEVETDRKGRTRWLDIALDAGGEARVASFRAFLDSPRRRITLTLSEDLLISRADAATEATATSPSV
jgi:hypothetical protein